MERDGNWDRTTLRIALLANAHSKESRAMFFLRGDGDGY